MARRGIGGHGITTLLLAGLACALVACTAMAPNRGELDEWNPAQMAMGRAVVGCLDALHIPSVTLAEPHLAGPVTAGALTSCFASGQPFGILLSALLTRTAERRK